jgi:acyl carrier protein
MTRSVLEIRDWIIYRVSSLAGIEPREIDPREPILRYGLDSITLVVLITELEQWLGYKIRGNPLADHPTIDALAAFLAEEVARSQ